MGTDVIYSEHDQQSNNNGDFIRHIDSACSSLISSNLVEGIYNNNVSKEYLNNMTDSDNEENQGETTTNGNARTTIHEASFTSEEEYNKREFVPPDGGFQAWLVMACCFLCNGVIFGIINSYGVIFVYLKEGYKDDDEAATKASLVGSLAVGTTFFLSPVSSILIDRFGIRKTAFVGGFIACLGMLFSSFFYQRVEALYFTYGIMFGGGSSLAYTPSLVILGHYFRRHMGLVNGIVTAGSSVFTIAMPHILDGLLSSMGLQNCLRFLTGLTSLLMLAALSFKPLMSHGHEKSNKGICAQIVNVDNWKNKKYVIWCLAIPSALFGYFVPYVHIVQHVKDILPDKNGGSLVTCIAITSGFGRLLFGKVADFPRVNRILLQQISFISIGICTMLLTAAPYFKGFQFEAMIVFALIMGLFDGCFITMLGPIAFDICGPAGASQAIGFLLGLCSIPLTAGPPIAGLLYDTFGNYNVAFLAAGVPPIVGALFMCCIYRVGGRTVIYEDAEHHRHYESGNGPIVIANRDQNNGQAAEYSSALLSASPSVATNAARITESVTATTQLSQIAIDDESLDDEGAPTA